MSSPTRSDRIRGMIFGQFVGDAAALGSHWIYDLKEIERAFPDEIQGFESPGAAPYHVRKRSGDQTHYGDGALLLLESVSELGRFDEEDFGWRFAEFFGAPDCRSYRDHATKETLAHLSEQPTNFQNGADDDQPGAVVRLAPIVALYGADEDARFDAVERATRITHNHPFALASAQAHAELLSKLLEGRSFHSALGELSAELFVAQPDTPRAQLSKLVQAVVHRSEEDVLSTTLYFGQSCPLVKTFPAALHAAFVHGEPQQDAFVTAIRDTLRAGGDNAARTGMLGAWLGAAFGLSAIPQEWIEKLTAKQRISAAIDQLLTKSAAL